jgi:imidazoleglycerol-phosphate dehydratase
MTAKKPSRTAELTRETKETKIRVRVALDGMGECKCDIQDPFLKHMVETLAKYSGADLEISARGDIEHHMIEDVAIAVGRAYAQCLGDAPVKRIASATVPMDEALVQVTVDLIDRPFVHIDLPDQMYEHFLRSFVMELRATVHTMVIRGKDTHHIIEATFKALGMALKDAMSPSRTVMSTKSAVRWRAR